jgi:hypothetical protein
MNQLSLRVLAVAVCSLSVIGAMPLDCRAAVSANQISLVTVDKGASSGVREPLQVVIANQAEWEALWKRHRSRQTNPPAAPRVDFSVEIVAGVFLGEKSTGGYEVEITRAEQTPAGLNVYYREKSPPAGSMTIQALTQPYHLVTLPKQEGRVLFQREK